ncbi:SET domain-containing protein [Peniophora sp. CONT]|nr:SET domain-containing protein [Peniophora sp. CONT]
MQILPMNHFKNTTYQPSGGLHEGFEPGISFNGAEVTDALKIDYSDAEYIATTLPQTGGLVIRRDGLTQCMCTGWFKRTVLSTPGFPSPIVHPPKVVYEVRAAEGRGLGVFATEDIEAGDLILAERPLFIKMVLNPARFRPDMDQEVKLRAMYANLEENIEAICSRMPPETLTAYKSLYNSHETDGSGPLTGIWRTNGFGVGLHDPTISDDKATNGYSGVGEIASRFNHSCSPSASHTFNIPSFSMEVHAVRPIAKGEEITVAYSTLSVTAATRQAALKPYGFTCTCPACKDPATSDKERERVLVSLLPKTSQGVKHAEEVLAAFEATGLQDSWRYIELLRRVAQIHRKWGNEERAGTLESLAEKVTIAKDGRKYETPVQNMNSLFESPEDLLKFIMQHANPNERLEMMDALTQAANSGSSGNSTMIAGPDGEEIPITSSDSVP